MKKLKIAITAGEPAGIGPDLCVQLEARHDAQLILLGDPDLLVSRASELGLSFQVKLYDQQQCNKSDITVLPIELPSPCTTGELNPDNASYVLETIKTAALGCQADQFDAMVTAPVHKGVINDAGIAFSGHTEFIADLFDAYPLMVLAADKLRVALATTHLPLREVAGKLEQTTIETTLQILHNDLRAKVGIPTPRILVCGLNPHAGESGHLGSEEIDIIEPAIKIARQKGIDAVGPLPADTLFTPRHLKHADAVLAMYHDQGLPVLKYAGFGHAVNITFGLPIIRTSVDHGTALDLAGTGRAEGGSLRAAIDTAVRYANSNCQV